ncbi:MAG: rhomboid family intramembrane serine protease [Roseiarcus sp.]|jgi:membrane associated rhomboid family serine protease
MTDSPNADGAKQREPMFFVPLVIVVLVAALLGIHAVLTQLGDPAYNAAIRDLAFVPGRLTIWIWPDRLGALISRANADLSALEQARALRYFNAPAGGVWTLLTYALLHGSWSHVLLNSIWLIAFGPPIARRFGWFRFLAFFALTAVAGALAHWAVDPMDSSPLIGASAADSGLMAAVARFMFQPGAPLGDPQDFSRPAIEAGDERPAPRLRELLRQRRAVIFILIWMALNFVFGVSAQAIGASPAPVAWIAHVGGFVAGLLAFPLFDRPWRRRQAP